MTDDFAIVSLFIERNELALEKCKEKYEKYIKGILSNILRNESDVEECFYDVLMAAWESIPPNRPESLKNYLGAIARNAGIDRYSRAHALKRRGGTEELLEEIGDFTPVNSPEDAFMLRELQDEINSFLAVQERSSRICFVLRYYHALPVEEIARRTGKTPSAVTSLLYKMRIRLKNRLTEQGYEL